jgi:arachidonate 15-lipoxygenase
MLPCLPADDPSPEARAQALAAERERYRFDRSLGGLPLAAEVPKDEHYSLAYMARATEVEASLLEARAAAAADPRLERARKAWDAELDADKGPIGGLVARADDAKARGPFAAPLVFASTFEELEALLQGLPDPASRPHADDDAFFAWQRLAGCFPAALRRLAEPDPRFPVTEAHFAAAIDDADDSLERAMAEGRLYLLDHTALHGLPTRPSFGFDRWLYGPLALFVRTLGGPFLPVAVQCGPTPDDEHPVLTPADGPSWRHAKLLVQASDAAAQGLSEHLGMCHVFANAVLLCTARELAPSHPLRLLLWPHFEMTLAANETMKTAVIGKDGFVDQLQGPTLDAGIELARGACARSVRDHELLRDLALRGVADREALPEYPYRDDALDLHAALEPWVRGYVELYYASDEAVRGDPELAAWHAALGADDGGGLTDLPTLDGRASLVGLLTTFVFRITAYHAVINYGGYDFYAWPGTLPTARWGPAPSPSTVLDDDAILKVLPPLGLAQHTLDLMLPQRQLRLNTLGTYPPFSDPRVQPLLEALQQRLRSIEDVIAARDARRPWSFPYLRPSRVAQSIHV